MEELKIIEELQCLLGQTEAILTMAEVNDQFTALTPVTQMNVLLAVSGNVRKAKSELERLIEFRVKD